MGCEQGFGENMEAGFLFFPQIVKHERLDSTLFFFRQIVERLYWVSALQQYNKSILW